MIDWLHRDQTFSAFRVKKLNIGVPKRSNQALRKAKRENPSASAICTVILNERDDDCLEYVTAFPLKAEAVIFMYK